MLWTLWIPASDKERNSQVKTLWKSKKGVQSVGDIRAEDMQKKDRMSNPPTVTPCKTISARFHKIKAITSYPASLIYIGGTKVPTIQAPFCGGFACSLYSCLGLLPQSENNPCLYLPGSEGLTWWHQSKHGCRLKATWNMSLSLLYTELFTFWKHGWLKGSFFLPYSSDAGVVLTFRNVQA